MTVEEIFSKISQHMLKGIMTHEQLANYYDFLALMGYKRCHEYHFLNELCAYRGVCRYFINHYNKLLPYADTNGVEIIPKEWYNHTRQEVDMTTKKNAVKNGFMLWVEWEKETKALYENMYKELVEINEVAAAMKVKELICDVDCELKKAEREFLYKKAVDFDMVVIAEEQEKLHEKYREEEKKIGVDIC